MTKTPLLAALICLLFCGSGMAAESAVWPMPPDGWFVARLPAPPAPHSFLDRMDVRHSISRQSAAAEAEFQRAVRSNDFSVFTFEQTLGAGFTPENFPLSARFFSEVQSTVDGVTSHLKHLYKRERLEVVHPGKVKLLVTRAPGFSYPSGHTARARVFALVLAKLRPGKRFALMRLARQIGDDRILSGQHYRSDVAAGRIVGNLVYRELMADPTFCSSLQQLKKSEWSRTATSSR